MRSQRHVLLSIAAAWLVAAAVGVGHLQATPQAPPSGGRPNIIHRQNEAGTGSGAAVAQARPNIPTGARPLSQLVTGAPRLAAVTAGEAEPYIEDFEGAWDDPSAPQNPWLLVDLSDTDGGEYLWGKRTCAVYQGLFSAFSVGGGDKGTTRGCTSNYPKNASSWAFAGPLDLTPFASGTLTYYFKGKSEYTPNTEGKCQAADDTLFVGIGASISPDDQYGYVSCGDFTDKFYSNTIDLSTLPSPVLGYNGVYLSLNFASDDDSKLGPGFSVDYVVLLLSREQPTPPTATPVPPTPPPTPAPGPSPRVFIPTLVKAPPPPTIPQCPDAEPNDQPTSARVITSLGETCSGAIQGQGEDDFYAVDVGAGKLITIDLTGIPAGADYDLYLYDQAFANDFRRQPVASSANGGNAEDHITNYRSPKAQRYYIRIYSRAVAAPHTYLLRVSVK